MRPDYRKAMLESEIMKLITEALREAKDPKISGQIITISRVELSNDKRFADVYVSAMGDKDERVKTVEYLDKIKGYFRTYLANNLDLYTAPQIRFKEDPGIEASVRIQELLNKIKEEETQ
ncbi:MULTISPECIES: 30S ribosome-binding factor RbfA [Pseudothermotoga]|jgi:ribosome-binding factor A|uniref:Ribosome-binding factor A n=1 Tax=Pseudothermotoga lettingae (strain ATCC BAA-301 / DSM 14385 / NBRC 107922 / TMO) TaxID=416591 RepID=RBFA_PSELT|nr:MULTISPECIES: 30S ribosome-binding factor RbfA [Pseudothermotoga]A8F701.1 RecName: Full=Ribosome-binding factor A [Pseudothermotoga lettingae TMO]ABV33935.1 ribosome-binding factor A [Pseudothermotoga lettingae TMO]KUK21957.1 MAG: Ribosome-binding factor A [Pseudothermotoga lettingae]MDI3494620.1 ribosome-binding factor [Pseudothermotoga sp.]MDK2884232.1 ribosome-binding factor [Pseudothermotoga sp.]GLI49128.1 ribosome-binding factor A [Pseudothermotoga lettingae TMO]